jgi:excisionase family DNA binding protein
MEDNQSEILTLKETAILLRVSQTAIYKLAQEGRIPCQKVGKHWRFNRNALVKWVAGNISSEKIESSGRRGTDAGV